MKRKQTTALILAALITASMAGCQAGSAQQTDLAETVSAAQAVTEAERQIDLSKYKDFPEGWSMDRVFNMISIDGYQLSLPCKPEDILALSEDFYYEDVMPHEDEMLASLCYKDSRLATIGYYPDGDITCFMFSDSILKTGYVEICGIKLTDKEGMTELMSTLGDDLWDDEEVYISGKFKDNTRICVLDYRSDPESLDLEWREINE